MKRIFTLLLCLSALGASATIWRLNNNPAVDADFRTFSEAQEAAEAGDTIFIEGNGLSNHYGNIITITKKLVIIGPGYFLNENDSLSANQLPARVGSITIEASAGGTEIYGMYIQVVNTYAHLNIKASNVIVARNYCVADNNNNFIILAANVQNITIAQNFVFQIQTSSVGIIASNLLISNNFVGNKISLNSNSNGVIVNNLIRLGLYDVHNSQIKNNIVYDSDGNVNMLSQNNSNNYIAYNLVKYGSIAGVVGPGNVANVDMSEVFLGYPTMGTYSNDSRWHLKPDGPAIAAGENGIDCGMFGGSAPYKLSGIAPVPIVYKAMIPTSGSTTGGLPVILKIKSMN